LGSVTRGGVVNFVGTGTLRFFWLTALSEFLRYREIVIFPLPGLGDFFCNRDFVIFFGYRVSVIFFVTGTL
jgi:hypothetical protein